MTRRDLEVGFVIATRASELALRQARQVQSALAERGVEAELATYRTTGDKRLNEPLSSIGAKGLFTKELDDRSRQGQGRLLCAFSKGPANRDAAGLGDRRPPATRRSARRAGRARLDRRLHARRAAGRIARGHVEPAASRAAARAASRSRGRGASRQRAHAHQEGRRRQRARRDSRRRGTSSARRDAAHYGLSRRARVVACGRPGCHRHSNSLGRLARTHDHRPARRSR